MGLNFYAYREVQQEELQTLQELLDAKKFQQLGEMCEKLGQPYHIGKQSYGWQFCFQMSGQYVDVPWEPTLESLRNVLSGENYTIKDEYDVVYNVDEFFNYISLYEDETHKNFKGDEKCYYYGDEFITEEGLWFSNVEFC